jgi:hypothetical protein
MRLKPDIRAIHWHASQTCVSALTVSIIHNVATLKANAKLAANVNAAEEKTSALQVKGFSSFSGTDHSSMNGLYASVKPGVFNKRIEPFWCLWYSDRKQKWYFAMEPGQPERAVAECSGASVDSVPTGEWTVRGTDAWKGTTDVQVVETENTLVKSGMLIKSPPLGVGKGWKTRFFMLIRGGLETGEPRLEYYEDAKSVAKSPPKGVFLLGSGNVTVGYGAGQSGSMDDTPSEESNTIRLKLQDRTAELTASSRIECRGWMQVLKHITSDEDFVQRRKRVGMLSIAVMKITGSTKGKAKPKYEKRWGVLDAAFLRLFASDEDVGTVRVFRQKSTLEDAIGSRAISREARACA